MIPCCSMASSLKSFAKVTHGKWRHYSKLPLIVGYYKLSHQHCKSAKKIGCYRAFFWDMPQYKMEVGAEISCFLAMFVSSIKRRHKWGNSDDNRSKFLAISMSRYDFKGKISFWCSKMLRWKFKQANIIMIRQEIKT